MAAIRGTCRKPPVVIPYLQYYFREVVDEVTPFTRKDLNEGSFDVKVEALSLLHTFVDCDWIRVTKDLPWTSQMTGMTRLKPANPPVHAERLLEDGLFDVAVELRRRFGEEKFVYGRVRLPYGELFGEFSDIEGTLIALKREPDRCKRIVERSIPQKLEEIRAWAEVGVHGLWLGQWLCSADILAEADYLEFVYPYDRIVVDAVRAAGLIPIHHFCGDVMPRLKYIKAIEPTVFGVEESKKGFQIDIGQVRAELGNDICLLGNVDTYAVVEKGSPDVWVREVERQFKCGGPEKFILSCGSPITFDTPAKRLREFVRTAKSIRDEP
jgi:hypothetical protein